ncbi:MAG: pre-peptidase [Gemmataceae bacterium]|nr:pre-peptidase [Gemmataceae bacterium]
MHVLSITRFGSSLLCGLCVFVANASSAPPTLTYLHPPGAQRGTTVEITAGGTFERWPVQVWTNAKAISAKSGKDKGKLSVTIAVDAVPGTYWLRLHDEQGASTLRPFSVGTLPDALEQEPNDDIDKAQVITTSSVVNGRLEKAGDVDLFTLKAKKGETLVASLDAHGTFRSPMDAVLQVLSADGSVLEQNNDWSGLDPQIVCPITKDGAYFVRLFAFPSSPDSSIRFAGGETYIYRLTLTTGPFVEYAVPLAVQRGTSPTFALQGWNIPAGAVVSSKLEDDIAIVHGPHLSNSARLRVVDHPSRSSIPPEALAPPFSITSRLEKPGVAESVRILGKKGQSLNIRVDSRELGLMVNPVIRVLDQANKQLARIEPGPLNKDAELNFSPTADGEYRIEVQDLHGGSGFRHAYHLRVAPPVPDFALSVANDRFAMTPGTPLDIPVSITRIAGHAKEIILAAEGLPEGIKSEVLPIAKDGKTVTLRLTAEKAGPSGSFRIVGKAKESEANRKAKAPLAEFETNTTDFWLAVGGVVPPPQAKKKR